MKIGILTQPLYTNYGGLVQCYALQTVLQRMGHETVILQREFNRKYTFKGACLYYVKHFVKLLMGKQSSWHYSVPQGKRDYIARYTSEFIKKNIKPRSKHCHTNEQLMHEVQLLKLDAIIVGSDQVWRPYYSPYQPNYFLDFLSEDSPVKRISYAASFGGDDWTFSEELTNQCAVLLKRFNSVSVREQSGIHLCKKHFGVDAVQVLDPTMLLEPMDYKALVSKNKAIIGNLFCYVLDRSVQKKKIIQLIADKTGLKPFESMPMLSDSTWNLYGEIDKCVYPPVEDWLSSFMEAEMVITDSFHGTVFSIIFNKPFWVIGNEGRGMARFNSLLSMFNLEDRLVNASSLDKEKLLATIDWGSVNNTRKHYQEESKQFIINAFS